MVGEILTCMGTTCSIASDYMSWMPTITIVILTVVFLIAILYALGRALGKRELEAFAKLESWQVLIGIIWVIIIGAFASFACNLSCMLTDGEDPFFVTVNYLGNIQSQMEKATGELLDIAKDIKVYTAILVIVPPSTSCMKGLCTNPYQGCAIIADNYERIAVLLAPFIGSIIAQRIVILMVSLFVFQLLLPIGVILRIIPFTREAGALLMGIAIAFYIIFPLTYVLAEKATAAVISNYPIDIRGPAGVTLKRLIKFEGYDCAALGPSESSLKSLGFMLPQAVFFPALSMIITIAAARTFSKVFMYEFQDFVG